MTPELRFVLYAIGLGVSFLLYGILQERIITLPYDDDMFGGVLFLVLVNRVVSAAVAALALVCLRRSLAPTAPWLSYMMIAGLNLSGTVAQYEAVKHISYPASVLLRSAKMIPVLFWGTLLRVRNFSTHDTMVAFTLTISCAAFMVNRDHAARLPDSIPWLGVVYCVLFLFLDGLTSTSQDRLFRKNSVHPFNLMFYVNSISIFFSFSLLACRSELLSSLVFASTHDHFALHVLLLALCSASGQIFIYLITQTFGAFELSLAMTTRMFCSVLLSCLIYSHRLGAFEWLCTVVVLGTLYVHAFVRKSYHHISQLVETENKEPQQ